jgi:hypothetical protein
MTQFIEFTTDDGSTFLVETDEKDLGSQGGIEKAGLVEEGIAKAQTLFEKAVDHVIQSNAKAFLTSVRSLSTQDQPESMEITFALKVTGEAGNAAIAKGTGEANYVVTLTWKREGRGSVGT